MCPPGTFQNSSRATALSDCRPCLPGFFCPSAATTLPALQCNPGYVCANGSITGQETPCPRGYFCGRGTGVPTPCAAGTFATAAGASVCTTCPARSYCPLATADPIVCPAGFWCAAGTQSASQSPCPAGRFSNTSGLATSAECASCSPGAYCGSAGLTAPTGPCSAGYLCFGGASIPTPPDGSPSGSRCTAGGYCPAGSAAAIPCPPGTYSGTAGNTNVADCLPW